MRLPAGFLGSRADVLMDVVLIAMALTPFLLVWAIRLARRRDYTRHRTVQSSLLCVLLVAVVAFEVDVRMSGGSAAFITGSRYLGTTLFYSLLGVHILVAVASFALWTWVVARGWGVSPEPSAEHFGAAHRRQGYLILAGVTFTSVSGAVLYWMSFVS